MYPIQWSNIMRILIVENFWLGGKKLKLSEKLLLNTFSILPTLFARQLKAITPNTHEVDLVDEKGMNKSKIQDIVNNLNFLGYYITSAKTGQGVIEAFNTIIDDIYYTLKALSS